MPFTVRWLDEQQTIILYTAEGSFSLQEHFDTLSKCHEMVRTVTHRVGFIFDRRNGSPLPEPNSSALMPTDIPANAGMTVIVLTIPPAARKNPIMRLHNHLVSKEQLSPQNNLNNYAAETINEAVAKLAILQTMLDKR